MFFNGDEKISKRMSKELEELVELQVEQYPFKEMNLEAIDKLRAKICLGIHDSAYFEYFMAVYRLLDVSRISDIIKNTYKDFEPRILKPYYNDPIHISEIVVNPLEEIEVIKIAKSVFKLKWVENAMITLDFLYELMFRYRVPNYNILIHKSAKGIEKGELMPLHVISQFFADHFTVVGSKDFMSKFLFNIEVETYSRIAKIVTDNMAKLSKR